MNKHGIALVFAFLVSLVLFILLGSFFIKSINENNLVKRYINSTHAFWAAEAGVAQAKINLPNSTQGTVGGYSYQTTSVYRTTINNRDYYDITSTGMVNLPGGGQITRTLNAVAETGPIDESKFIYAIDAANTLCFGGNCSKQPEKYLDPTVCNGHTCWNQLDTAMNFTDLFGCDLSAVKSRAIKNNTYYKDTIPDIISGITWVDVTPGSTLMVTGSGTGTGILIVNGNVHFGGKYLFNGIIYTTGTLDIPGAGTFDSYGSILIASTGGVDDINGNPTLHWSPSDIRDALKQIALITVRIVSWKEAQ